jgi:hypothetical protein
MKCRIPDLQAAVTPTFRGDIFKPLVVLAVLLAKWKPSFQVCTDKRAYRHQLPNCRQLEVETLIPTQAIPFGIPRQGNDALEHQCSGAPSLALFKQALSRDPFVIR